MSSRCRFHLHTHVNGFCISTVGALFMKPEDKKPEEIGLDRLYETMVFRLNDAGDNKADYVELDFLGYDDPTEAADGHMKMCRKYARKKSGSHGNKNREF